MIMSFELNTGQLEGILKGESWWKSGNKQTFEISGAAGTGKTTFTKYLIDRLGLELDECLFVAYMGKAVNQMSKSGLPAKTLHSVIYDYIKVPMEDDNGNYVLGKNGKIKMVGKFIKKDKLDKKIKLIIVDEGSTVERKIGEDLLSFGIPVIVLGDLNQLQPPFGTSIFLERPDVILTQIMRQAEGSPIIYLAQQVLNNIPLKLGVYGNSAVVKRNDITEFQFRQADIVLTGTNKLRYNVNKYYREYIKGYKNLEFPHIGEKLICRRNNWDREIGKGMYLTNGTTGICDYFDRSTMRNGIIKIDFKPDFTKKVIKDISIDKARLNNQGIKELTDEETFNPNLDVFEYAYAITTHSSQGSQYPNVLVLNENFLYGDDYRRWLYTAITRASDRVTIVM